MQKQRCLNLQLSARKILNACILHYNIRLISLNVITFHTSKITNRLILLQPLAFIVVPLQTILTLSPTTRVLVITLADFTYTAWNCVNLTGSFL